MLAIGGGFPINSYLPILTRVACLSDPAFLVRTALAKADNDMHHEQERNH